METSESRPQRLWARILAGLAAGLGGLLVGPAMLVATSGSTRGAVQSLSEGGLAPVGAAVLGALALAALVPLSTARRIPSALLVGVALLPWLVGCLVATYSTWGITQGVGHADPATRASVLAASLAGYFNAHLVGAQMSLGLGAGLAGGLAWASLAAQTERRLWLGAGVGLGLSIVPVLIVAAAAALTEVYDLGASSLAPQILAALAAGGPLAIAGMGGATADRRSEELATAATLAAVVLLACAAPASSAAAAVRAFGAVAGVEPSVRAQILERAGEECLYLFALGAAAFALSLVVPAAAALRAHLSKTLARQSYVGGALATGVLLAMLAFHLATSLVARGLAATAEQELGLPLSALVTP